MNMQDKEMDELFRSKLDNYEIEPSNRLWSNISNELGAPAQRKSIAPFLRIAASVAILITAGLYFIPKMQRTDHIDQPKGGKKIASIPVIKPTVGIPQGTHASMKVDPATRVQPSVAVKVKQLAVAAIVHKQTVQLTLINTQPQTSVSKVPDNTVANNTQQQVIAAITPKPTVTNSSAGDPQQIIASIEPKKTTAVVPDDVKLVEKADEKAPAFMSKPASVIAAVFAEREIKMPAKKLKIHGIGGLLNAVVAVVDKRDEKFIEFADNDEGNIKVKKQK